MDASTGELHWSDETFRILEYDPSTKPTIERVLQRIHPDDRAMRRQLIDETSRGEKDFDITHRLLMPDGSVKFVHVLSHALKDAAGNLEVVGSLMDVSDNTRLYRDLAEREAKIRRLVEANIIGVFIGDQISAEIDTAQSGCEAPGAFDAWPYGSVRLSRPLRPGSFHPRTPVAFLPKVRRTFETW